MKRFGFESPSRKGNTGLSPRPSMILGVVLMAVFLLSALLLSCHSWNPRYQPVQQGPFSICVTFDGDPEHEATIHYQSLPLGGDMTKTARTPEAACHYDVCSHDGDAEAYSRHAEGTTRTIKGLRDGRRVHSVSLKGLAAGQTYYLTVGNETTGYSPEIKFKTLPGGDAPLRFVVGGDMGGYPHDEYPNAAPLLREAAKWDPQFVVVGGDIAYAGGDLRRVERWDRWFESWTAHMVTSDGCTIPIIASVGNHEVNDKPIAKPTECAPFYTAFFRYEAPYSYFGLTLGDYARLFVLDNGYLASESGAQSEWLARELETAKDIPIKLAVYHVPMYPGHRDFDGDHSTRAREAWLPLFDRYGLNVAFENHDHMFKRTYRLRGGKRDPEGTLYVGDGCFGVPARKDKGENRWYLEKHASQPHFWLVNLHRNAVELRAITPDGTVFDRCSLLPKETEPSAAALSVAAPRD